MTKKHDPAHAGHIALPDGRWLDLRPMYVSDKRKLIALDERTNDDTVLLDYAGELAAIIDPAVTAKSWDGSLEDMTELALVRLAVEWRTVTEEDALPEASGTDSAKTS